MDIFLKDDRLNKRQLNRLEDWFSEYVGSFVSGNEMFSRNIRLKQDHSLRVRDEIMYIAHCLGLGDRQTVFAAITALFHDIGRFEQYARYHTFVDADSVNHARLSVEILRKNKVLHDFDPGVADLAFRVISYHNMAKVPDNENDTCLFFSRLLRDADKLDIWHVVTEYYARKDKERNPALEIGLPDTDSVSTGVIDELMNAGMVSISNLETLNDFKLLQVGWVYDLNFLPSIERLRQRGYLDRIRRVLPDTNEIREVFEVVDAYMDASIS
ncbi:MAG: HD domain-containing protein [Thermodesulfobacteriota bacterium]|nr:HD domain-containing protein [Thermodesulfobacteriota bacterium]